MFEALWAILGDETNQKTLTWLGGGLVVAAGGAWTVIQFIWSPKKSGAGKPSGEQKPPATNEVLADRGGLAAGGNITIDNSISTGDRVAWPGLVMLGVTVLGVALIAAAFIGPKVTARDRSVAAGGDIRGAEINIGKDAAGDRQ